MSPPGATAASAAKAADGPVVATCAVIGTGLIGGSIALAAAAMGTRVRVWDRDPAAAARVAERSDAIEVAADAGAAVAEQPLAIVALPVAAIPGLVRALAERMNTQTVVTDVGSIKVNLQREIEAIDSPGWSASRWVGGHPMAGRAAGGSAASDGTLFHGATWVLAPTEHTDADAFALVRRFVASLGAHVLAVSPDVHDRLVGVVSHLPQLVATELMLLAEGQAGADAETALAMAAGGFRDATRVAGSDPDLWAGILRANRASVLAALDGYRDRLEALRDALAGEDWEQVRDRLVAGRAARARLPAKQRATDVVDLVIPVDDRPGMVARVATALGEAAVNIEDLHLRHADELVAGAMVVTVGADVQERARQALAARDLPVRVVGRQE